MFLLALMALKISYTDFRFHRISNRDLIFLVGFGSLTHRIHMSMAVTIVLILGIFGQRFLGAGDTKLLALIISLKANSTEMERSLSWIFFSLILITFYYLIRKERKQIPIGPALSLGLIT